MRRYFARFSNQMHYSRERKNLFSDTIGIWKKWLKKLKENK